MYFMMFAIKYDIFRSAHWCCDYKGASSCYLLSFWKTKNFPVSIEFQKLVMFQFSYLRLYSLARGVGGGGLRIWKEWRSGDARRLA